MVSGDKDGSSGSATGQGSKTLRWEGVMVLPRAFSLLFSPVTALVTHMGNVTVQERHLHVYNQAPCIIKTFYFNFYCN